MLCREKTEMKDISNILTLAKWQDMMYVVIHSSTVAAVYCISISDCELSRISFKSFKSY